MNQNLEVFEYAARQVKQTVVGTGAAEKAQVQHMVRSLLKLSANPQADAADATAIAITHCHLSQNVLRMSEGRLNGARAFALTQSDDCSGWIFIQPFML